MQTHSLTRGTQIFVEIGRTTFIGFQPLLSNISKPLNTFKLVVLSRTVIVTHVSLVDISTHDVSFLISFTFLVTFH